MRFSELTGHSYQIERLIGMVDSGKLPHALLFHGPAGVGKTAVARAFIQYLNCTDRRNGDSCGRCPSCLQTEKLNNPDIHYIYPIIKKASNSKPLSADFAEEWKEFITRLPYMPQDRWLEYINAGNSRPVIYVSESEEIIRLSSLSAYGVGKKIFLIWLPEKMNIDAANKLLKVIEEPFDDTMFIMVSNNPGDIMPTIMSRLQSISFSPIPDAEIFRYFIKKGKSEEEAVSLSRIAKGNMNRAMDLLDNEGELKDFTEDFIQVMRGCYSRNMPDLKMLSEKFADYGREKSLRLLSYFSRMLRESFISNLKCDSIEAMSQTEKKFVGKFGPFVNADNVEEMVKEIDRAYNDITRNANQKIVWFDLFLELTRLIRTKGIKTR